MNIYIITATNVIDQILYLTIEPRQGGTKLSFYPGQYATIGFRGKNGRRSPMRCFSITSSATSGNLEFAMRVGGDFTRCLASLPVGEKIYVQGPFGEFVQEVNDQNIVMIAGGIGVTPFMSMVRTAANSKFRRPMTLLYSCRTGRHVPFYDELRSIEKANERLRVILFATDQTSPPESPRTLSGRMTEKHVEQITGGEYEGSTYFVCGPERFIADTEAMLQANGIDESRIISESFTQSSEVLIGSYNLRKFTYAFATLLLLAGIGAISALDLSRYVPSHTVSATSTAQTTPNTTSSNSTDTSANTSSTDTSNTNASNNTSSSNSSSQNTYQAPVTSVS